MLKSNSFRAQDIHIHQDMLSVEPSALSRKRERKPGTELQKEKKDKAKYAGCILCHPDVKKKKNPTGTTMEVVEPGKVASFLNVSSPRTPAVLPLERGSGKFDIALSSHFLFFYSAQLSAEFHLQALREMLRVAREVRVFPLLALDGAAFTTHGLRHKIS